jgi:hypothetical protein
MKDRRLNGGSSMEMTEWRVAKGDRTSSRQRTKRAGRLRQFVAFCGSEPDTASLRSQCREGTQRASPRSRLPSLPVRSRRASVQAMPPRLDRGTVVRRAARLAQLAQFALNLIPSVAPVCGSAFRASTEPTLTPRRRRSRGRLSRMRASSSRTRGKAFAVSCRRTSRGARRGTRGFRT